MFLGARTRRSNHRLKRSEKSLGDRGYQFCDLSDPTKLTYCMLQAHSVNMARTRFFPQIHYVKRRIFHVASHVFPRILHTRRLETTCLPRQAQKKRRGVSNITTRNPLYLTYLDGPPRSSSQTHAIVPHLQSPFVARKIVAFLKSQVYISVCTR